MKQIIVFLFVIMSNAQNKPVVFESKVVSESNDYSLLLLNPDTGRKHQLRRQLSFIKHPILGEKKYTNKGLNKSKELHLMLWKRSILMIFILMN